MAQETYTHQVVLSNVPTKYGGHTTLTFYKKSNESTLRYYDLFEYMEQETSIPRFYFTLKKGNTCVRFTDMFSQRKLYKMCFTPNTPLEIFHVSVDIYATHKLFDIHKTIVRNISRDSTKLYALESMMTFMKKYIYKSDVMLDYCIYFTKFPEFIRKLSREERYDIMNSVDDIIKTMHEKSNYIYNEDVDDKTFHMTRKKIDEMERKKNVIFTAFTG